MRHWTIDLSERELRLVLTAFDIARDDTINVNGARWWNETKAPSALYNRLVGHGLNPAREKTPA